MTPVTVKADRIQMDESWKKILLPEFSKPYMLELKKFLQVELAKKKNIYPRGQDIFAAFNLTPLDQVKVVILGQDPYHGPNQAHGLCFSVRPGVAIPPSLKNIYKEMETDLAIRQPPHGCLEHWAAQGVLMLNATLSVEAGRAGSHQGRGWELFTDRVIEVLNQQADHVVFVLWGAYAQRKGQKVDRSRHLVLESVHPSPLSAHRGFFGCRHFSKINAYLGKHGKPPIDWQLPPV